MIAINVQQKRVPPSACKLVVILYGFWALASPLRILFSLSLYSVKNYLEDLSLSETIVSDV